MGVELLYNWFEFGVPKQLPGEFQTVYTRCGKEGHTRPKGALGKPPMEWTPTSREQERHNVTVITVGSKYKIYVRSPASSHMQTLSNPYNKLRGKILLKKSSCVFILRRLFLRLSFCVRLSLLLLSRYDTANEYITQTLLFLTIHSSVSHLFALSLNVK